MPAMPGTGMLHLGSNAEVAELADAQELGCVQTWLCQTAGNYKKLKTPWVTGFRLCTYMG